MIIRQNKALEIKTYTNKKESHCDKDSFSYFGFWDYEKHGDEELKHVSQLEKSGSRIYFYTKKNQNDDLLETTRDCFVTLNEDDDSTIPDPDLLRLYAINGTPNVYEKIKQIPPTILKSLKKKPKDWKIYLDFMGTVEKTIAVPKASIFKNPAATQPTKMYLIKGDKVEILSQDGQWVKIRYYGKATIEGWLRIDDIGK
ncbi:hypothetical protein [Pedobacter xixiisoli]|uniref:SH3 domain-containing protein n=1 Tax=Pedobacter xixiisoli TaxID=1476464 RepID=A0A286AEN1_9SPHI|nr:hypothetical protein [Pedobacter xixiisoli]SOD20356.1 hypothetical protein SAMN06297358_4072 [Pedobacter xixiisoli]